MILYYLNHDLQRLDCKNDISEDFAEPWKIFFSFLGKRGTGLGIFIFHN